MDLNKEGEKLRGEIRLFLDEHGQLAREKGIGGEEYAQQLYTKIGEKGWLGLGIPEKYGGAGGTFAEFTILQDELLAAAPEPVSTAALLVGIVVPPILAHGGDEIKRRFLPAIAGGKVKVCLGCTEPEAGSDTSNVQTRAVLEGDKYIVNGTKLYNDAYGYDYMLTTVRTDVKAPKEDGISMLLIDLKTPGIEIIPIWMFWTPNYRRNEVHFDDVEVPSANLVGDENRGWHYLVTTLRDYEWVQSGNIAQLHIEENFQLLVDFVKKTKQDGRVLSEFPSIRHTLADLATDIEVAKLFYQYGVWLLSKGVSSGMAPAMAKLYTTGMAQRLYDAMINITGEYGQLERTPAAKKWIPMRGRAAVYYKFVSSWSIAGWSSEMQRDDIASRGLGLPSYL
ncbi:MAG: acyl-CoA dehydrogenase family protein [Dehalococcoidia bacterium]|nr:acyl-CoA dehydrogenase family protein [Dehalococcoidia bacterium]